MNKRVAYFLGALVMVGVGNSDQSKHLQVGVGGGDPASASPLARAGVLGTVTAHKHIMATVGTRTVVIGRTMGIVATAITVTAAIGRAMHIADGISVGAQVDENRLNSLPR